jgi:hypothetical protein
MVDQRRGEKEGEMSVSVVIGWKMSNESENQLKQRRRRRRRW